jgi:ArsR family transcriptional regulator
MADVAHAEQVADLLKAFGQVTRLAILEALRHGESCVSDLGQATGQAQSNISKHLGFLRRAGVLAARRRGLRVFYRVAAPEVFAVLEAAQALLARGLGPGGLRFPPGPRHAAAG